jgi:hypothetical protein
MANFNGVLDQFNTPQAPGDLNLINSTLAINQAKYDQGEQNYENNLAQLKVQENLMVRDEDKARFSKNVQGLINEINGKEGGINWAKRGLTNKINAYTNKALDSYTLDQIGIGETIRAFGAEVAKKKEKNDGSYNDTNYSFAQYKAGLADYRRGYDAQGNKVDKIGNLSYKNYHDVEKKVSDKILELEKLNKDQEIEEPILDFNGQRTGEIRKITISNLSPEKIRQIAINSLNGDDLEQIKINGYGSTGGYSDPQKINEDITSLLDKDISKNQNQLDIWTAKKNQKNLSDKDKAEAKAEFKYYNSNVTNLNKNKKMLLEDKESAATYLERNRLIDNATSTYAQVYNKSEVFKVDEIYQNRISNARADAALQLEKDKFTYTKDKDAGKFEANNLIVAPKPTPKDDIENIEGIIDTQIKVFGDSLNKETNQFKLHIDNVLKTSPNNEDAKEFMAHYNENIKKGQTPTDAIRNATQIIPSSSSILISEDQDGTPKNYRRSILDISGKYDTYVVGRAEAIKVGTAQHIEETLNNSTTFKAFFDNPETKMMWYGKNGKEGAFSVKEVLINNGLMNTKGEKIGDIKNVPSVLAALQKSYAADNVINNSNGLGGYEHTPDLKKLANLFGESVDNVSKSRIRTVMTNYGNQEQVTYDLNPNTKTGAYLLKANEQGIKESWVWSDQSLNKDDATISQYGKSDYKNTKVYKDSLEKLYGKIDQNYSIGITKEDKNTYARVNAILSSDAVDKKIGDRDPENTFNVSLNTTGDKYIISQNGNDKEKGTVTFQTQIDKATFDLNLPQVGKKLNTNIISAHYTVGRTKDLDLLSQPIRFLDTSVNEQVYRENAYSLGSMTQESAKFIPFLQQNTAVKVITDRITPAFGANSEESRVITNAMKNSSDFSITGKISKDFDTSHFLTLMLKNKKGETIFKKTVNNVEDVDNYKQMLDNTPQVLYADMINDIMSYQISSKMLNQENSPYYEELVKNLK